MELMCDSFLTKQKLLEHIGDGLHMISVKEIYTCLKHSKATCNLFGEKHHIEYFGLMGEIHSFEMKVAPLHIIQESFLTQTTL